MQGGLNRGWRTGAVLAILSRARVNQTHRDELVNKTETVFEEYGVRGMTPKYLGEILGISGQGDPSPTALADAILSVNWLPWQNTSPPAGVGHKQSG
jgi:hypothetical protein